MTDLLTAVALAFAIEGALYALFPAGMRAAATRMLALPDSALRTCGLCAAAFGVLAVWAIRG